MTLWQDCPSGSWIIANFSNFTQMKIFEKKKLIATLLDMFEESSHGRISDLLIHKIKKVQRRYWNN